MKKLRLNNIFHWLYAILMFLPFICVFGYIVSTWGTGTFEMININNILSDFEGAFAYTPIDNVFEWIGTFLSMDNANLSLLYLFPYWICISILWLCFDVLMFLINLAHRWIDRGTDL